MTCLYAGPSILVNGLQEFLITVKGARYFICTNKFVDHIQKCTLILLCVVGSLSRCQFAILNLNDARASMIIIKAYMNGV